MVFSRTQRANTKGAELREADTFLKGVLFCGSVRASSTAKCVTTGREGLECIVSLSLSPCVFVWPSLQFFLSSRRSGIPSPPLPHPPTRTVLLWCDVAGFSPLMFFVESICDDWSLFSACSIYFPRDARVYVCVCVSHTVLFVGEVYFDFFRVSCRVSIQAWLGSALSLSLSP